MYYFVYLLFNTDSLLTSSPADWDLIEGAVVEGGKEKFMTIKETLLTIFFLAIYWKGCNYFLAKIGLK